MSFLQFTKNCKHIKQKHSLTEKVPNWKIPPLSKQKTRIVRKTSLPVLPYLGGSMTLEAAMVLPLFLFFVLNILSVIEMLRFHGNMTWALHETGSDLALYGGLIYEQDEEGNEWLEQIGEAVFSYTYVRNQLYQKLGEDYIETSPVKKGKEGILFSKTDLADEEDALDLVATYRVQMPFSLGDLLDVRLYNCCYMRRWTGYEVPVDKELVYITETGSVYHTERSCMYLDISVRKVGREEIGQARNKQGKKYTACEKCGSNPGSTVWVTEAGERYHGREDCSSLKRSIREIKIKDAKKQGYPACSQCGV